MDMIEPSSCTIVGLMIWEWLLDTQVLYGKQTQFQLYESGFISLPFSAKDKIVISMWMEQKLLFLAQVIIMKGNPIFTLVRQYTAILNLIAG